MIALVLTLVLLLGLVAFAAHQLNVDHQKKIAVLRWVDEREIYQRHLVNKISDLRALGAVPHIGQIDGVRTQRFGSTGPATFMPSATGMKQLALAMDILKEREGLYNQLRDGVVRAYGELVNWERTHPMPDPGNDYAVPPRPQKAPETKPAPKAFLDVPIHNKELTR